MPPLANDDAAGWWQAPHALPRFLTDLIRSEATALRPGLPPLALGGQLEQPLGAAGAGLDSLERLQVAAAVSEALHMQRSGVADRLLAAATLGEWCDVAAASLSWASSELTFRSSGSTGAPKAASHALAELQAEAADHAARLGPVRRVLSAVPCHHIYGFIFTIALPCRLATPVVDIRAWSPAAVLGEAEAGDVIIGYPEFWAAILRACSDGWRPGVVGVSSTAPLPDSTAAALLAAGLARLIQVHGSSETAGIGLREQPGAAYQLLPAWHRTADGSLAKPGAAPVAPPDALEWVGERHYRLTGRKDGMVQVAGLNVSPRRVEAVLCEHPEVAAAAVRLMRPGEGARLKAFVVPRDPASDASALRAALHGFTTARLSTAEQPRAYTLGPALPVDPIGKLTDWVIDTDPRQPHVAAPP